MAEKHDKPYRTANFGCAASLIMSGLHLTDLEIKAEYGRVFFIFADYELAKHWSDKYWLDQLCLNPKVLFEHAAALKERLREVRPCT